MCFSLVGCGNDNKISQKNSNNSDIFNSEELISEGEVSTEENSESDNLDKDLEDSENFSKTTEELDELKYN